MTAMALPWPSAVREVPSIGSTATSVERLRSVSDELAVEQHRGFVLLALADDDDAAHRDGREHRSHCFDRRPIGTDLVAPPDPS